MRSDHVILGEPDAESHHQFRLIFVDLFEVYLPFAEALEAGMLYVGTE